MVLDDLYRRAAECDVERVVQAEHRVLQVIVHLKRLDPSVARTTWGDPDGQPVLSKRNAKVEDETRIGKPTDQPGPEQ